MFTIYSEEEKSKHILGFSIKELQIKGRYTLDIFARDIEILR